jgi:amylosucrase
MHSIIMSTGGIPLLYLGDELGTLNDYSYMSEPDKWDDSRWVNRPKFDLARFDQRKDVDTTAGQIFAGFQRMIKVRKATPEFAGGRLVGFRTHNPAILGYQRPGKDASVLCLANFSDDSQWVGAETLGALPAEALDLVTNRKISTNQGIHLASHEYMWLKY